MSRARSIVTCTGLASLWILGGSHATADVLDFQVQQWSSGPGADGQTYAIVTFSDPLSWREARAIALQLGGDLAATPNTNALSFVISLTNMLPGSFLCAGPWVGGYRFGGQPWKWTNNAPFISFAWDRNRPGQAAQLDAAICLGGLNSPNGTLFDALPGPDAGATVHSALLVWGTLTDCDQNGIPDALQIAKNPALDADGNGAIDGCTPTNPADFNGDGRVNGADLGLILSAFNSATALYDLNHDGLVNGGDLGIFLGSWSN